MKRILLLLGFMALLWPCVRSSPIQLQQQRVKRVAIVGGGPAGMGLAACLKQLDAGVEEVIVFDSRDPLAPALGGGVQLTGGASILEKIGCLSYLKPGEIDKETGMYVYTSVC